MAMLTSQKEGLQRSLKAEQALYVSESDKLHNTISEGGKAKLELEKQLDEAKKEVFRLQSVHASVETDVQCKEQLVSDLRKQIREADDALAAAVAGNEHLRCQMEEQRLRFEDMNEAELNRTKNTFEDKLTKLNEQQLNERQLLEFQIKSLEDVLGEKNQQHDRLMKMMEQMQAESADLERDCAVWRVKFDEQVRDRHELERDY